MGDAFTELLATKPEWAEYWGSEVARDARDLDERRPGWYLEADAFHDESFDDPLEGAYHDFWRREVAARRAGDGDARR